MPYRADGLPMEDKPFNELLAERANLDKDNLVAATLMAFKDGDASAMKLVTQALLDSQYVEEVQLVISDERLQEICCLIADNSRSA